MLCMVELFGVCLEGFEEYLGVCLEGRWRCFGEVFRGHITHEHLLKNLHKSLQFLTCPVFCLETIGQIFAHKSPGLLHTYHEPQTSC